MRDPFTWSFPADGRSGSRAGPPAVPILACTCRWVHAINVPGVANRRQHPHGTDFLSVPLHEFGHCFMARQWGATPTNTSLALGGLANVDAPTRPVPTSVTAGGPLVNLAICVISGLALVFAFEPRCWPPLNPLVWSSSHQLAPVQIFNDPLGRAPGTYFHLSPLVLLCHFFRVNWGQFLLNVLILGYPLDGGRCCRPPFGPSWVPSRPRCVPCFPGSSSRF